MSIHVSDWRVCLIFSFLGCFAWRLSNVKRTCTSMEIRTLCNVCVWLDRWNWIGALDCYLINGSIQIKRSLCPLSFDGCIMWTHFYSSFDLHHTDRCWHPDAERPLLRLLNMWRLPSTLALCLVWTCFSFSVILIFDNFFFIYFTVETNFSFNQHSCRYQPQSSLHLTHTIHLTEIECVCSSFNAYVFLPGNILYLSLCVNSNTQTKINIHIATKKLLQTKNLCIYWVLTFSNMSSNFCFVFGSVKLSLLKQNLLLFSDCLMGNTKNKYRLSLPLLTTVSRSVCLLFRPPLSLFHELSLPSAHLPTPSLCLVSLWLVHKTWVCLTLFCCLELAELCRSWHEWCNRRQ